jgi:phosphomannomutase/phosphoglucomutase
VVDHQGNLIWNDTLVSLFAKDMIHFLPGCKIVYNALCSKQVDEVIQNEHGVPCMWKTGHSFIKAKVKEERAPFGGELSGHFFFVDNFYGHDDGAIGTLRLLAYLTRRNLSLKKAIDELPQYISSPEIKLGCPDVVKFQIVSDVIGKNMKKQFSHAKFTEIDGIRMDTADEMAIVRASQNGPYLTVKIEAKKKKQYDTLKKQIKDILLPIADIDWKSGVNTQALNEE